jgi:hypothetical protein
MTQSRLEALCPVPLCLVWHENKSTYLSVRKVRRTLHMRVHRLFYDAPTPVLEALIRYALKPQDRSAHAMIKQMAHLHFSQVVIAAEPLPTKGHVYDLQEIFHRLLSLVPIEGVSIGWSRRSKGGKFHSITFGTYDRVCRQIRINAILDDPQVPLYFLEFIVYHEMLHALCPSKMDSFGRCWVHTAEFRSKERQFPQYQAAKEWEKKSLTFFKKRKSSHGRS